MFVIVMRGALRRAPAVIACVLLHLGNEVVFVGRDD
jgi:hypothetical protein